MLTNTNVEVGSRRDHLRSIHRRPASADKEISLPPLWRHTDGACKSGLAFSQSPLHRSRPNQWSRFTTVGLRDGSEGRKRKLEVSNNNEGSPVASDDMGLKALLDQHLDQMRRMQSQIEGVVAVNSTLQARLDGQTESQAQEVNELREKCGAVHWKDPSGCLGRTSAGRTRPQISCTATGSSRDATTNTLTIWKKRYLWKDVSGVSKRTWVELIRNEEDTNCNCLDY
ncbi:hypothetical protein THAOC_34168 [Thalassiosira oceanica]|uniref:Uncharacterized protein n=1 Tax=Thalassiosira oceanica TaxID=159749 RepID=K0RDK3_THAOC|nr:hypothetical protein THAOC_34168 [Thalassiosira oceanica]|eukprot:EJK47136.1 hypothetical protein THAOC_34168 [Thalassiosira oceanica]